MESKKLLTQKHTFAHMSKKLAGLIPVVIYILVAVVSYFRFANELPRGVHAWGQSDRYAIAKRYTQTGMNPLYITTYNIASEDGRTGAELPLPQYLAAAISMLGLEAYLPFLVRLINFLIFSIGLFALFRTILPDEMWLRSLLPAFVLSSPIIGFYAFNFLPDIAGLGFILWSYACLLKYLHTKDKKWIFWCLSIAFIGALVKLTVVIFFIAHVLFLVVHLVLRNQSKSALKIGFISIIPVFIVAVYLKTQMIDVNEKYWSVVFRAHANPIKSWANLVDVVKGIGYWRTEYLSVPMYVMFFAAFAALIWVKGKRLKTSMSNGISLVLHSVIVLIGLLMFFVYLGKQFIHHDYYMIATFMPLVLLLIFWFAAHGLKALNLHPGIVRLLFVGLALYGIGMTPQKVAARMGHVYEMRKHKIDNQTRWLENADKAMVYAESDPNDVVFVLYHESPNIPLVRLDRKGMCFNHEELSRKTPFIEIWLNKLGPRYLVAPLVWHQDFEKDKPELMGNLKLVLKDNDMVVWEAREPWPEYQAKLAQ